MSFKLQIIFQFAKTPHYRVDLNWSLTAQESRALTTVLGTSVGKNMPAMFYLFWFWLSCLLFQIWEGEGATLQFSYHI